MRNAITIAVVALILTLGGCVSTGNQEQDRIANLSRLDAVLDIVSEEYSIYLEGRAPSDLATQLALIDSAREIVKTAIAEYLDDGRYSLDDLRPILSEMKIGYLRYVGTDDRLTDAEKNEKARRASQVEALVMVLLG